MKFLNRIVTNSYGDEIIQPNFIVIHYTGGTFQRVKQLFENPSKAVSAHFVIDKDGSIDKVVEYAPAIAKKAWHAGKSMYVNETGKAWTNMNLHAIGIEIVNVNGNICPYTQNQIYSSVELCKHLAGLYQALNNPYRVVGHEHIAGDRGKADPGKFFPWEEFYELAFPNRQYPKRNAICPDELISVFAKFNSCAPLEEEDSNKHHLFWHAVNATMEKSIQLLENIPPRIAD